MTTPPGRVEILLISITVKRRKSTLKDEVKKMDLENDRQSDKEIGSFY